MPSLRSELSNRSLPLLAREAALLLLLLLKLLSRADTASRRQLCSTGAPGVLLLDDDDVTVVVVGVVGVVTMKDVYMSLRDKTLSWSIPPDLSEENALEEELIEVAGGKVRVASKMMQVTRTYRYMCREVLE